MLSYALAELRNDGKAVGHLRDLSPSSIRMVYNRLTKWQKIFFILAENGSQKICIYPKKAVLL